MPRWKLFYRLMMRPLFREPVRLGLMVLAVGLGVAVVLAIELAGNAAAGSFHSSMESLAGDNDLEVVATGGVPESVVATLATQPYPLRLSPRMEDFAVDTHTRETLPLIGLDLIAEGSRYASQGEAVAANSQHKVTMEESVRDLENPESVWISASLGKKSGEHISLLINDRVLDCVVRGVFPEVSGNENAILMDIAGAQRALNRFGRVDRILIKLPANSNLEEWQKKLSGVLPPGVQVRPQGTGTEENRKMLAAFRWNLRLLSYIALVVGAFLIYNTISVSVVRRRTEIGILRELGASRGAVLAAFIGEEAFFGLAGAALGLPVGRVMASGAVKLMAATVESLYVSSRPGAIELSAWSVVLAFVIGVGVAIVSAYSPAREASLVSPVEAMARGRREYVTRVHKSRDLWLAFVLGILAAAATRVPAFEGKPVFGYLAAILMVVASALAIPAFTDAFISLFSRWLGKTLGVEALLAAQSLSASLRRTSVLVGALSTAIAMMTSVGIMVGSFRETVLIWMNDRLPADLYLRPAGEPAPDRHPTVSLELADRISQLPGIAGVDRLRAYEISYDGMPATLASVDLSALRSDHQSNFFSGRPSEQVLTQIRNANAVVVSEPFTYKHHVRAGDSITLRLGTARPSFRIADVYYDYGSERGSILKIGRAH